LLAARTGRKCQEESVCPVKGEGREKGDECECGRQRHMDVNCTMCGEEAKFHRRARRMCVLVSASQAVAVKDGMGKRRGGRSAWTALLAGWM